MPSASTPKAPEQTTKKQESKTKKQESETALLMLKRSWPGDKFRRTIKNAETGETKQYEFGKDQPTEIPIEQLPAFDRDIGKAIVMVRLDDGRIRIIESLAELNEDAPPATTKDD